MNFTAKTLLRSVLILSILCGGQLIVFGQPDIAPGTSVFVFTKPRKFFSNTNSKAGIKAQTKTDDKKAKAAQGSKTASGKKVSGKIGNALPVKDEPIAPEEWINENADYAIEERKISDSEPFLSLTNGFLNSRYQFCATPQFPAAARRAKQKLVQSKVLVTVAKYGGVLDAKALEGDPSFRAAVYETLGSMRFRESFFMGQPIRIEGLLLFTQNPANEMICNTAPQEVEIPPMIDGGELAGFAKTCEVPGFPADAKATNLKSVAAKVQVMVGEDGKVADAKLLEGHPAFGQAAVQSALKSVFPRSLITSKYVKVSGTMTFAQTPDNQAKCGV